MYGEINFSHRWSSGSDWHDLPSASANEAYRVARDSNKSGDFSGSHPQRRTINWYLLRCNTWEHRYLRQDPTGLTSHASISSQTQQFCIILHVYPFVPPTGRHILLFSRCLSYTEKYTYIQLLWVWSQLSPSSMLCYIHRHNRQGRSCYTVGEWVSQMKSL